MGDVGLLFPEKYSPTGLEHEPVVPDYSVQPHGQVMLCFFALYVELQFT